MGSKDNLLFYSSIKHSVFARIGNSSAEDKKAIKLPANASLEEVINPKIEHAIEDYVELYAKGTISEGMMVTNWIDRYINIFLRAAGIPIFNEK